MGELATFSKGCGYSKSDLRDSGYPIILYGRLYTQYETEITEVDTFIENDINAIKSYGNEVIVPASGETSEEIARASAVGKKGIVIGGDLNIIRPKQGISTVFLALSISNGDLQKNLSKKAQGKSVVHIRNDDLKEVILKYPSYEEQTQIGNFFKQLDDTIALHQRELEKFKILKTSYLENIFLGKVSLFTAKNTITWEQRKFLDNIESIIDFRGRTPRKLGMEWGESGYLALSALNVKNGYIDPSVDAHFGDEALYQKWMTGNELKQGQVLFTTEAPMGNVAQIPDDKKYILSQRTIAFNIKEKYITDDFLAVLLRSPNVFNDLDSLSSGGTAKGISQKSLSNLYVKVPNSLEEQTQIGNFFKQLDDTIALHQKELAKYQQIKTACLEKMFME